MHWMEPAAQEAVVDCVIAQPRRGKLRARYEPVLLRGELGNRPIAAPPGPIVLFAPHMGANATVTVGAPYVELSWIGPESSPAINCATSGSVEANTASAGPLATIRPAWMTAA